MHTWGALDQAHWTAQGKNQSGKLGLVNLSLARQSRVQSDSPVSIIGAGLELDDEGTQSLRYLKAGVRDRGWVDEKVEERNVRGPLQPKKHRLVGKHGRVNQEELHRRPGWQGEREQGLPKAAVVDELEGDDWGVFGQVVDVPVNRSKPQDLVAAAQYPECLVFEDAGMVFQHLFPCLGVLSLDPLKAGVAFEQQGAAFVPSCGTISNVNPNRHEIAQRCGPPITLLPAHGDLDIFTQFGKHVLPEQPELVVKMDTRPLLHLGREDIGRSQVIRSLGREKLVCGGIRADEPEIGLVVVVATPWASGLGALTRRAANLDELLDLVAQLTGRVVLALEDLLASCHACHEFCHIYGHVRGK